MGTGIRHQLPGKAGDPGRAAEDDRWSGAGRTRLGRRRPPGPAGGGAAGLPRVKPDPTRRRRRHYERRRHRRRNVIERFSRKIKPCRRVATRYDKKPQNYAAPAWLAAGLTATS